MRKVLILAIFLLFLSVGLFALGQSQASAQNVTPPPAPQAETNASGTRVSGPNALTSKQLSNPYCYQPNPSVDQCFINIRYYQAADNGTSAPFMLRAKISINNKARAIENLFFENNLYYSYDMTPGGFQVPCGAPNAGGGGSDYGNQYLVKVEPIDSTGAGMGFDEASLLCPAYVP